MRPFSSRINKVDSLSLNTDFLIKATLFDILLEVTTCTDGNDNIDFMISPGDVLNQSTPVKATVDLTTSDTTTEVNAAVNLATTIVSAETSTLVSTTKNSTTLIPDESSSVISCDSAATSTFINDCPTPRKKKRKYAQLRQTKSRASSKISMSINENLKNVPNEKRT